MAKPTWIGKTLGGRYQIESLLGQGGMSAVYKATDPNLGRVVAVKLIHPHLSSDPEFVRRFEEEARAVAQLRHPNIIQVYDFDHDEDAYYIVFEFVPGETLQARLKRLHEGGRTMPLERTVSIGSQMADALNYAHNRGLIHRDVKPANVMLNVQNEPILMDFGIVKIVGGTQHTATGAVMGTARYMSPEQIKGERVDERTDLYSLGVMLFEMASGRAPFEADSAMTVMMMHVNDPVPDLSNLRPEVPLALKRIINRALAKDPGDRFQGAGEIAEALRNIGSFEQTAAADPTVVETPEQVQRPATADDPKETVVEPVEQVTPTPASAQPGPAPAGSATGGAPPTSPPGDAASPATASPPAGTALSRRRMATIGIGALLVFLLLACGVGAALVLSGGNLFGGSEDGENGGLAAGETPEAIASDGEEEPGEQPTATEAPATATATTTPTPSPTSLPDQDDDGVPDAEDACPTEAAGLYPDPEREGCPAAPTATVPPTITPTPTVPSEPYARINDITIDNGVYVVDYETFGYMEQLPGMHVHFFYDTVAPEDAGNPGSGPWILWGGPRPFREYTVSSRPAAAEQMCILVANPDHSIIMESGNCYDLPEATGG
ncbi:MAG: protein kinase [Candidatus Promineifilaceae bacterium]|nr:protein kinase [Candidatus Promineifilaceae bacterium]